jgi:acetyl-CoA decarbonylase/synthase complex subunit gamma
MNYIVPPGLYAIGSPESSDPVLVTANYKMSFDLLRQELTGRNCWLLVLETYGINVWCAAGKGTFGTGELVRRIESSSLAKVVTHRKLLLPILGAPGVAAHEVQKRSGFSITYATIRATDLPQFLDKGMVTTPAMREITFSLYERSVLIPVEIMEALTPTAVICAIIFILAVMLTGAKSATLFTCAFAGAVMVGVVAAPLILPWLPSPSFAIKGATAGLGFGILYSSFAGWNSLTAIAASIAASAVSGFYTLNFTGCTPYTSRSGVKLEMRRSLPAMAVAIAVSSMLLVAERFIG